MKKTLTITLLVFIVTGGAIALTATGMGTTLKTDKALTQEVLPPAEPEAPGLTNYLLEQDQHNFGEVKMGDTARYTFWFTNTGKEDLVLEKVKPSCSCTASNYTREPIAPGEKGFVEAVYPAKKAGVFRKTVTVTANSDPRNKVLTISGEVVN